VTNADYSRRFSGEEAKEAFKVALDTRKFEIELYWKRATYFWAFIAAAFVGFGASQSSPDKDFLSFFLSSLGFVLSLGWVFANRGSKQWQENWEHHVDHLEDKVTGPLFKTTLPRAKPGGVREWVGHILVGPSAHSVSKINQLISLYIALMWLVLVFRSAPQTWNLLAWPCSQVAVLFVTAIASLCIAFIARTHMGPYGHNLKIRQSDIEAG